MCPGFRHFFELSWCYSIKTLENRAKLVHSCIAYLLRDLINRQIRTTNQFAGPPHTQIHETAVNRYSIYTTELGLQRGGGDGEMPAQICYCDFLRQMRLHICPGIQKAFRYLLSCWVHNTMIFDCENIKQFHSFQEAISSECLFRQMRQKIKYGLAPVTIAKRSISALCG